MFDRLVTATQLRFPVVGDLARSVRFRWFDQPLVDAERASVLGGVGEEIVAIAAMPAGPDRDTRIDALANIPEQIVRFLAERIEGGDLPTDEPMLAVLIKRHYRDYALHDLTESSVDGRPFAVADYTTDDRPTHLVTTIGQVAELAPGSGLVHAVSGALASVPAGHENVIDLYLSWPDAPESAADASTAIAERLAGLGFAHEARRITVATCPGAGRPVGYFTFRPDPSRSDRTQLGGTTLAEDVLVRGVHPMVGRRLTLGGCASSTSRGSMRRRTSCSTGASLQEIRPTSGWSPSPRCASSPSSATTRAGWLPSPTSSGRSRTVWRRSAACGPPAVPRALDST